MLFVPPPGYREVQNNLLATPAGGIGASAVGDASIHTKGAWTQMFAATSFDVEWVVVGFANSFGAATQTDALVDIGVGGAGAEVVLIPDLLAGWAANSVGGGPRVFCAPLFIPRGTRVSARVQGLQASKTVNIPMWLFSGSRDVSQPTFSKVDAIGVSTAASQGTSVTAGNSGAEGSWTSIGSTTARDYKALYVLAQGTLADTNTTALTYHFEVGFSSTALAEFFFATSSSEQTHGPTPSLPVFHHIPSGTQLQIRGESSGTAEPIDMALYGLY